MYSYGSRLCIIRLTIKANLPKGKDAKPKGPDTRPAEAAEDDNKEVYLRPNSVRIRFFY